LIYKSGIMLAELSDLEICPALDEYRDSIGIPSSEYGAATPAVASMFLRDLHIAAMHQQQEQQLPGQTEATSSSDNSPTVSSSAGSSNESAPSWDNDYVDYGGDDNDDFNMSDIVYNDKRDSMCGRRTSMCIADARPQATGATDNNNILPEGDNDANNISRFGYIEDEVVEAENNQFIGKIHWDSVFDNKDDGSGRTVAVEHRQVSLWQQANVMASIPVDATDEYNFFNFDVITQQNNNDWAGSRHWKVAGKSRTASKREVIEEAEGGKKSSKSKKTKQTKPKSSIDFATETPSEDLFVTGIPTEPTGKKPRAKADPTILSDAMLAKQEAAAEENAYLLPEDAHIEVLDLCRLMLVPNILYPYPFSAVQIRSLLMKKHGMDGANGNTESIKRFNINSLQDKVWGEIVDFSSLNYSNRKQFVPSTSATKPVGGVNVIDHDDNDDYNGGFDFGDGDDGFDFDPAAGASEATDAENTLSVKTDDLLKAARVVEKVAVG
jgi:hypothetical protein